MVAVFATSIPQVFHENSGTSIAKGTVSNGSLENAFKLPWKGDGFKFFILFDYFVLGRCYVPSDVHRILIDSYEVMSNVYLDYRFSTLFFIFCLFLAENKI